ncbi:methionine--tRNA ligase [Pyramidobacter sp. SM-530-WT-4B]|uniref:Methionine--tRNA ligase n=1 Tax=Pyramidobacter porci TaxID=2605789 RepID=A0A6L5YD70_9BACT|nr:methionine--tRNA ligase [Pyramidobacter porci]MCI6260814.1 methionine--tRNA ligase [Pyramidobacter sp.]MDY2647715.1 methionine--tRNA ligase [Pyramidobacter porci]MST55492.1 methionine--tRNA ligase [Pyramidobacter porci]
MAEKNFYITTPIYYVNDVPHIGHAYTTIAADAMARYKRMDGCDVFFLTGTDEHGQKVSESAAQKGMTPQQLTDELAQNFRDLLPLIDASNDDFIRTTEARHVKVVQQIFKKLLDQGDIYKGTYKGWYCVPCETYVPEASQGENHTCPDCHRPLKEMEEESYFLRTSAYADRLLKFYEEHPDAIKPRVRYNEVVSFLRMGMKDQSISRTSVPWGIPVPGDEEHTIYVWFDALINYLTACGYGSDEAKMKKFWPVVNHLVGKDIIRFHCIVWPIMLLALGLTPPACVYSHGWWTRDGEKMSKSKGNVVDPHEMVALYGSDVFRYFLLRQVTFGLDGDFSELALVQRINSDLANDLGNLLSRTVTMIEKYRGGTVPAPAALEPLDAEVRDQALEAFAEYRAFMDNYQFDDALKALWSMIGRANKYIDETMPWKLGKDESLADRLDTVLATLAEELKLAALMLAPVMPKTAVKIWAQLGLSGDVKDQRFGDYRWGGMGEARPTVRRGEGVLYPRIDLDEWKKQAEARANAKKGLAADPGEHEPEISIDDFAKVELRVAQIVHVEPVPKSRSLYKLDLDLGYEKRVIVSSIKDFYKPEDLEGRRIVVVANLKPAKMCGVMSNGMLLAAGSGAPHTPEEKLSLLAPVEDIPLGSRVH